MKRNIDGCGSNRVPYIAEKPVGDLCAVNMLPNEVLEFIFSRLSDVGMQSVYLVSKEWSQRAINTVQEEYNQVTNFIKTLGKNLLSHESESRKLYAIAEIKGFNLIHINEAKSTIKEYVLYVMKSFSKEDLDNLEKKSEAIPKPLFFLNLFRLAPIYSEWAKVDKIVDSKTRASKHIIIANQFEQLGLSKMKLESIQRQTSKCICKIFARNGLVDDALEVVDQLKSSLDRSVSRKSISELLIERGELDAAQKVAVEIRHGALKIEALKLIYKAYIKIESIDEAEKIHQVIYPDVDRSVGEVL